MMSWSAIFLGWEGWLSMELALPCAFFPWVCSFVFTGESPGRRGFFLQPMLYVVELSLKGRVNGFDSLETGLLK